MNVLASDGDSAACTPTKFREWAAVLYWDQNIFWQVW